MNGSELKYRARSYMAQSSPRPMLIGLAYIALTALIAYLSARILGGGITQENLTQYTEHVMNGNYEYAVEYLDRIRPPFSAYTVEFLLNMVMTIVSVGFMIFLLNTVRGTGACFENLLDGFGFFWKIILLSILQSIFITLWTLLLVVPGLIAAYRYRMAYYILIDHPEYSPMQCIRESKRMMDGHKWELFGLDVSFIGWWFLAALPGVGYLVQVWTRPYFGLTYALYYEQLRVNSGAAGWNTVEF